MTFRFAFPIQIISIIILIIFGIYGNAADVKKEEVFCGFASFNVCSEDEKNPFFGAQMLVKPASVIGIINPYDLKDECSRIITAINRAIYIKGTIKEVADKLGAVKEC